METTGKVKNRTMMTLAILFISSLEMGGMGMMPSLAAIQADFPNVPTTVIQTMANWPGLVMLLGCIISTALATKVSKKVLCQFGVACSAAIGILGYLFNSSIVWLFLWSSLLGLGFGFLMPTSNGVIAEQYDKSQRGKLMGIQDLFTNAGGIYLTYVGGALAAINWHMNYLAYLIGIIPFVLGCIYLPNDKPAPSSKAKEHFKVSPKTWMYGIIIFVFINAYNVFGANISFVVTERAIGNPAIAGTAMSLFLVGGMLSGLLFGPTEKRMHDYTFCIAFLCLATGYLIVYFANALALVYLGAIITGMSIGFAMPMALLGCTNCNTVLAATAGCGVAHICGQLGTVCSPWFFTPVSAKFSNAADFRYLFAAIVCAIVIVLIIIVVAAVNKHSKTAEA